jgi:hypothetical protein
MIGYIFRRAIEFDIVIEQLHGQEIVRPRGEHQRRDFDEDQLGIVEVGCRISLASWSF